MRKRLFGSSIVACAAMLCASPALAGSMTFNGTDGDGGNTLRNPGFVFVEGDWQYEVSAFGGQVFTLDNNQGNFDAADDDVVFMQNGTGGPALTFTHTGGLSFNARSVDTIGGFSDGNGTLKFTGFFTAGGSISMDVPVSNGVITNTLLAGFVDLTRLEVAQATGTGNFLALDNIGFEVVPAPGAFALLGVAGLALRRRRRH